MMGKRKCRSLSPSLYAPFLPACRTKRHKLLWNIKSVKGVCRVGAVVGEEGGGHAVGNVDFENRCHQTLVPQKPILKLPTRKEMK